MKGIPRGRYTKEFRQEAVKLVIEEKLSWGKAGQRLSLASSTIGNWVKAYQEGKLGDREDLPAADRSGDGTGQG